MDIEIHQERPPRVIAWLFNLFSPRELRAALAVERRLQGYTTLTEFCVKEVQGIRVAIVDNAREAFNVQRHVGDVLSVVIASFAYWAPAPAVRLTSILAAAIPVLIWRDAHTHRKPSPEDAAVDGLFVGAIMLVSQALLFLAGGSSNMAWMGLFVSAGTSMVFVSGWRIIFRMKHPPREPALKPYRRGLRMTLLWLIGAVSLLAADRQILASNSHLVDSLLGAVFFPLLGISLLWRSAGMGSLWFGPVIRTYSKEEEFKARMNRLFGTEFAGFWSQFFERLVFVWIALPMVIVVARVALGRTPPENVNWMLLISNAGGFAVLCKTWIEVKKINERAAAALQNAIDTRKKDV